MNKYIYWHVLQMRLFGFEYGWEDLEFSTSRKEILALMREHVLANRNNNIAVRIIKRREDAAKTILSN